MTGDTATTRILAATGDAALGEALAAAFSAADAVVDRAETAEDLLADEGLDSSIVLLDAALPGANAFELCRELTGGRGVHVAFVTDGASRHAEGIARFCGAWETVSAPFDEDTVRAVLAGPPGPTEAAAAARGTKEAMEDLSAGLLRDLMGEPDEDLISAITDPETKLLGQEFLAYKVDEEFKRAQRFQHPLGCVMLGFEGEADEDTLLELAGLFLTASRDTDILGRYGRSTFLFLLPYTGLDGARVMADRISADAQAKGLRDITGDPMRISCGITCMPSPAVEHREQLVDLTQTAFNAARESGGGIQEGA